MEPFGMRFSCVVAVFLAVAGPGIVSAQEDIQERRCIETDVVYPPWEIEKILLDSGNEQEVNQRNIANLTNELLEKTGRFYEAQRASGRFNLAVRQAEDNLEAVNEDYENRMTDARAETQDVRGRIEEINAELVDMPQGQLRESKILHRDALETRLEELRASHGQLESEGNNEVQTLTTVIRGLRAYAQTAERELDEMTRAIEVLETQLADEGSALEWNRLCQDQAAEAKEYSEAALWNTPERLQKLESSIASDRSELQQLREDLGELADSMYSRVARLRDRQYRLRDRQNGLRNSMMVRSYNFRLRGVDALHLKSDFPTGVSQNDYPVAFINNWEVDYNCESYDGPRSPGLVVNEDSSSPANEWLILARDGSNECDWVLIVVTFVKSDILAKPAWLSQSGRTKGGALTLIPRAD